MKRSAKAVIFLLLAIFLLAVGYFQGYLHGTIGGFHSLVREDAEHIKKQLEEGTLHVPEAEGWTGDLNVTVNAKPFGMHLRKGSTVVEEVFPGFPAQKLGIRKGCEIKEIQRAPVTEGTWMEAFQSLEVPFDMRLFCPASATKGQGPLSADEHNYRVMVVQKPYGMNVQVNVVPRVVDVLPGYPAELAGVKRGFVLKAVNDQPVNADNWFDVWQQVKVPCTLTFDTNVPLHKDNPFFNESTARNGGITAPGMPAGVKKPPPAPQNVSDDFEGYGDFKCVVKALPFGMRVHAPPGKQPSVVKVVEGTPAKAEGVRPGDLLVEVAGRRIDSRSWFATFEQAVPPFGLKFKRLGAPLETHSSEGGRSESHVGNLDVMVTEKPFGMHVRLGTVVVDEVFPGFPAKKLGIRSGCQIRNISGKEVSQGTWLVAFNKAVPPFSISLFCPPAALTSKPLRKDLHSYRVMVTQRPFGMNVQVNVLPRVKEVVAGSAAEAAGVKPGFVLTHVNEEPVDAANWFDMWQKAPTPSTLTFDTSVPAHPGNAFFENGTLATAVDPKTQAFLAKSQKPSDQAKDLYESVSATVRKLPFGMHLRSVPLGKPVVDRVVDGMPAAEEGVRPGDVLVEIAGLPIDDSSWFDAFQRAAPPFGLRFDRPRKRPEGDAASS